MWKQKKKWFTGVKNLTIVTPSQWLADRVKESFLGEYPVRVIHNGVDLSVFRPDAGEKNRDGVMLLGVSYIWDEKKGLDAFIRLAQRLPEQYRIVLVGTDDAVDAQLPENITAIHRTQNQQELASLYAQANLFVNPTREEVLGLVNLEALACGTPVVTFDAGGSPECVDEKTGMVVPCGDVDALEAAIYHMTQHKLSCAACVERAQRFEKRKQFAEYLALYDEITK
jgi:glycosyltransferase involved in cell wall biosynthesis